MCGAGMRLGASLGFASVRAMANVVVNAEIAVIASSSARAADPGKPAIYEYDSHCR